MPNHVTNNLIISGVSEDRLNAIRTAIAGVDSEGNAEAIDFNKIIPMPPEMHITSGGYTDYGMVFLHPEMAKSGRSWCSSFEEAKEKIEGMSPEDKEKALKEGEQAFQNIQQHGYKDWYEWANANWGTKWGAYSISVVDVPDRLEIQFDTAWATPYPVMQKLSEMFPDAQVSVTYADEDLGQNCGRYSFLNGEETELYQPEGGSDEAMNLAIEIKGYQDELYKDEATGEWRWHSDDEQDDHTAEIENQAEAEANEG